MTSAGGGLGDLMRDPDEAIRRMDEWAAGFARKAERYAAAQEETERLRLTASSPDGTVRVTVGADGVVSDLVFSSKTRTMPPEELSRMVLETMRRAQSGITERVAEVMTEQLGDEDQETRGLLLGSLRDRFPDPDEPEDGPPEPGDDPDPEPVPPAGGAAASPPSATPPPSAPPVRRPGRVDPDEQDNNPW
ncbi:YbaB/EbfC family nucleoid-associated protein [Amycolatopsis sp. PS_44_ISF1]|uniref:YbaB/EbfC family nucleoid-associated protein n=1 Tax=Amycolatopsis sp. PS_44_ISF1 TaxID=2974917 RepID=UPI0028DDA4F5|nr:YbaB/EbfC family nucleoid-associated protein [Amycolatopsis sp. PS_44_ISF1]MDT8912495.1 YbaB/EbfC family nucleoid-associated protein [Amycolatopsis sp. PS_44_ISF1]